MTTLTPDKVRALCAKMGITTKRPLTKAEVERAAHEKVKKENRYMKAREQ